MTITQLLSKQIPQCKNLYIDNFTLNKSKSEVTVNFLTSLQLSADIQNNIAEGIRAHIPQNYKLKDVNFSVIYCNKQTVKCRFEEIVKTFYPSIFSAIDNIKCDISQSCNITAVFNGGAENYIGKNVRQAELCAMLREYFGKDFTIKFDYIYNKDNIKKPDNIVIIEEKKENKRIINVLNSAPLTGREIGSSAMYICDCKGEGDVTLCGKMLKIEQRPTKKGKTIYSFILKDFTASMQCIMFPASATLEKLKKLENGSEIILQGEIKNDGYSNALVCMPKRISYCELPKNFVVKKRDMLPPPKKYTVVKPQRFQSAKQVNIFENSGGTVPQFFEGKSFAVFDVETTGLNSGSDRITEIAAVKITDGQITHEFSTLVNPKIPIRSDTVKLNGIDDNLIKDSPEIEQVIPDFYKFTYGCAIVAHNIEFDLKFVSNAASSCGYYFENDCFDTVKISREKLKGLSNYKLDTLCKHLDIDLTSHHRALNDAIATAKLFIKLHKN